MEIVTTGTHRPRNYGEPTDRGYEKAMDTQTDWVAFARTQRSRIWAETQARELAYGLVRDVGGDFLAEYERQKLAYEIAMGDLPLAEPFWVTSEVSEIVAAACHKLPAVELRPSDLLVPHGFVVFEKPIPEFYEPEGDFPGAPLEAFAWTTFQGPTERKYALVTAFSSLPGVSEIAFPGEGQIVDYEFPIARLAVVFWLLAKQRLLSANREAVSRPVRRRAKSQEIKTVTVVQLRRLTYPETNGSRKVDWSHRWLVRGFYRNQWYPSEGRHRPIWIFDYVKGPADKPFVAKNRAFEFRR